MNDIPRRIRIDLQTPIEAAIRAARDAVESGPAHPHMTRATNLLGQALDAVADFVDGVPEHPAAVAKCPGCEAAIERAEKAEASEILALRNNEDLRMAQHRLDCARREVGWQLDNLGTYLKHGNVRALLEKIEATLKGGA